VLAFDRSLFLLLRLDDRVLGRRAHPQGPGVIIEGRDVLIVEDIVDSSP
jgi:hypothetical protein